MAGPLDILRRAIGVGDSGASSEIPYRAIVEDQLDFIVRWKPDGTRTWVNDRYCEYFGKPRETLIGTSFFPLIADEDRQRIRDEINSLTIEQPVRHGIHAVLRANGEKAWHEWTDRAVFDKHGRVIEMQSVGRDVTDRKLVEDAIVASEARYRTLVESTDDWVWEMDLNGSHTYSNERLQKILGYSRSELSSLALEDLIYPDDYQDVRERLQGLIANRKGWSDWLVRFRHRNGGFRYLNSSAQPVFSAQGELVGYRGIDRDLTFRTLHAQITSDLVKASIDQTSERIERGLARIAETLSIDRCSLNWFSDDQKSMQRILHVVRSGAAESSIDVRGTSDMPWVIDQILQGKALVLPTIEDIPQDQTKDRKFFSEGGITALLIVPLVVNDEIVGVGAFVMLSGERGWRDSEVRDLSALSDLMANAVVRRIATEKLELRERELARTGELASVGSYRFESTGPAKSMPPEGDFHVSKELLRIVGADFDPDGPDAFIARVHPEDRPRVIGILEEAIRQGGKYEFEYRMPGRRDEPRHVQEVMEVELRADEGVRIFGAIKDVTELVEREDALRDAYAELEKLKQRLHEENVFLREEMRAAQGVGGIVGESPKLKRALVALQQVAPTDATILLLGDTGTGKDLMVQAAHTLSDRRYKPLISVNCAALSHSLIESELFGHEKGAFTGAQKLRKGRFELADGGTLFLDEIGELPLELQSKLLRVLQNGTFERLGGTETIHVDARIIAATNRDLLGAVDRGEFRADLYYRLNSFPIEMPSLREREEDIPLLAEHLAMKHAERLGKSVEAISARTIRYIKEREWPGNIRELESFIERALISSTGNVLDYAEGTRDVYTDETSSETQHDLRTAERNHILSVLVKTGWKIAGRNGAAAALKIPESTLRSMMKRLQIKRPQ